MHASLVMLALLAAEPSAPMPPTQARLRAVAEQLLRDRQFPIQQSPCYFHNRRCRRLYVRELVYATSFGFDEIGQAMELQFKVSAIRKYCRCSRIVPESVLQHTESCIELYLTAVRKADEAETTRWSTEMWEAIPNAVMDYERRHCLRERPQCAPEHYAEFDVSFGTKVSTVQYVPYGVFELQTQLGRPVEWMDLGKGVGELPAGVLKFRVTSEAGQVRIIRKRIRGDWWGRTQAMKVHSSRIDP